MTPGPHDRSRTLETTGILAALRDRWWIVALTVLTGLGGSVGLLAATDELYESSAGFYVAAVPTADQSPFFADDYVATRAASYAVVVEGEAFRERVVDSLDDPADDVHPEITARFETGTALLTVTVTDTDPDRAFAAAREVTRSLPRLAATLDPAAPGGTEPLRLQAVEPPVAPEEPVAPSRPVYVAGGLVLGALLGAAGAVALARADSSLRRSRDLARLAEPPVVLGLVGIRREQERKPTWTEGFRTVHARLLYYSPDVPRTVLVTSAVPGEGKTLVATELATAAARSGQRVLLVDADLRRPAVGAALGLPEGPGLVGVVHDGLPLATAVEPTAVKGLDVLPAGLAPDNPLRVLTDPAFEDLLEGLAAGYDLVVLDAPPVLPVADAALLAGRADATVLVTGARRVRIDQVDRAQEQLARAGATVVGMVLSGVRSADLQEFALEYVAAPRRERAGSRRAARAATAATEGTGPDAGDGAGAGDGTAPAATADGGATPARARREVAAPRA